MAHAALATAAVAFGVRGAAASDFDAFAGVAAAAQAEARALSVVRARAGGHRRGSRRWWRRRRRRFFVFLGGTAANNGENTRNYQGEQKLIHQNLQGLNTQSLNTRLQRKWRKFVLTRHKNRAAHDATDTPRAPPK